MEWASMSVMTMKQVAIKARSQNDPRCPPLPAQRQLASHALKALDVPILLAVSEIPQWLSWVNRSKLVLGCQGHSSTVLFGGHLPYLLLLFLALLCKSNHLTLWFQKPSKSLLPMPCLVGLGTPEHTFHLYCLMGILGWLGWFSISSKTPMEYLSHPFHLSVFCWGLC